MCLFLKASHPQFDAFDFYQRRINDILSPYIICILSCKNAHFPDSTMRTTIVIDDTLMEEALKATGLKTKRETVEKGLETLVRLKRQEEIRDHFGKLKWEGNLDEMRTEW